MLLKPSPNWVFGLREVMACQTIKRNGTFFFFLFQKLGKAFISESSHQVPDKSVTFSVKSLSNTNEI